jgi:1-acyl-sn-glycerol-3-phosphate acyltransferase
MTGDEAGAAIVPVASWGSEKVISKGAWLPRRADVHLRIGESFQLPATGRDGKTLSNQEAAEYMMLRVTELLPTARSDRSPAA